MPNIKVRIAVMICVSLVGLMVLFFNGNMALTENIEISSEVRDEKFGMAITVEKLGFQAFSMLNEVEISASMQSTTDLERAAQTVKALTERLTELHALSGNAGIQAKIKELDASTGKIFEAGKLWVEYAVNQEYADSFAAEEQFKALKEEYLATLQDLQEMAAADLKISLDRIHRLSRQSIRLNVLSFGIAGPIVLFLSVITMLTIVRPLEKTIGFAREIAAGDVSNRLDMTTGDEIGKMNRALNVMVEDLARKTTVAESIARGNLSCRVEIASDRDALGLSLQRMLNNLKEMIDDVQTDASRLSSSSESLDHLAGQLAAGSERMSDQTAGAADGIEEVSSYARRVTRTARTVSENMDNASRTTEGLSRAVIEIGGKVRNGSQITEAAMGKAEKATRAIMSLHDTAEEIGKVTTAINEITDQTKLLALNATIEAARAGDKGKGFAVVAGEVKELAKQSSAAAENIAMLIAQVQDSTREAVEVISEVSEVIRQVNESSDQVAAAVEEQAGEAGEIAASMATANEAVNTIAVSIQELAEKAREVSSHVQEVNGVVAAGNTGIQQISGAAGELSRLASHLEEMVGRFRLA